MRTVARLLAVPLIAAAVSIFPAKLTHAAPPATPTHAATCGGNIVYDAKWWPNGQGALYVDTARPVTAVWFYDNDKRWQLVPNTGDGVDVAHPLGRDGRNPVYGLSSTWISTTAYASQLWRKAGRWRVFHRC